MDAMEIIICLSLVGTGLWAAVHILAERRARQYLAASRAGEWAKGTRPRGIREKLEATERDWSGVISDLLEGLERQGQFPQVPESDAERYRSFAILKAAAGIAGEGRPPGVAPSREDAEAAAAWCERRAQAARALVPSLRRAHELWATDIQAFGMPEGPAGDQVQVISDRLEDLALQGGDLNLYLWSAASRLHKVRVIDGITARQTAMPGKRPQARA